MKKKILLLVISVLMVMNFGSLCYACESCETHEIASAKVYYCPCCEQRVQMLSHSLMYTVTEVGPCEHCRGCIKTCVYGYYYDTYRCSCCNEIYEVENVVLESVTHSLVHFVYPYYKN